MAIVARHYPFLRRRKRNAGVPTIRFRSTDAGIRENVIQLRCTTAATAKEKSKCMPSGIVDGNASALRDKRSTTRQKPRADKSDRASSLLSSQARSKSKIRETTNRDDSGVDIQRFRKKLRPQ